ncbi:MAG: DUF1983 domain-containing protein [Neisseria sp.]|nr:DUF1983 domain-containing protein [Neisseria sp.]
MVEPVGARVDRLEQTSVTRTQAEALAEEKIRAKFQKPDTRNDNRPPSWYWENYPRQTASEFKTARALGLGGGFCVLETNVPWGNASGGAITQTAYKDDGTVQRRKSDTAHTYANGVYTYTRDTWTEWVQDETVKGAQAKADAVKRIADEAAKIARKAEADFKTFTSTYTSDKEAAAHRETELKAKIANIKGGRNYLEDSGFTRGLFGFSQGATNGSAKVSDGVVTITSPTATWRQWQIHGKAGSRANNANSSAVLETLQAGETYTLSFWARAVSGSPRIWTRLRENRTGGLGTVEQMSFDVTPTRDWQRFEQSFTVTSDTAKHDFWRVILATSDVGTVEFKQPMLQLGVQAADWQPAPEDISASVKTVSDAQVRADGRVSAMHTLQVNANGHIAGIGLQSDIEAGRAVSRLIFQADRVGFASGNLQTFPFTVDTQRNQVGIDGTMIVNGKAVIDRLASGDIVGDKIKANSLNANRLTAGSITSRELKAGAVTADKISANVITGNHIAAGQSLRSPSINAGSINGGNINIGNGQFMVDNNGVMTANAGVFKGRIEAEDGFFNGTVRADKIEGDVLKVLRMRRTIEGGTVSYSLAIPAAKRALMLKLDDFKFLLPDDRYTRIKVMINELLYREFGGGRGSVTAITPWLPFPANQEIRLEITANPVSEHGLLLGDVYSAGYPTVSVRFMDDSDPVMQSLNGDLVWLKVPASKLIHIEYVAAGAIYWLPPDIYGIRTANGGVHGLSLYSRYGLMYQHPSTSKGRKWTHLFAVPETLKANIPKVLVDSLEVLTWRGRIF